VISIAFEIWDGRCEHVVCALVIVEIDTREIQAELFARSRGGGWPNRRR
jgi:hypothetical protein